MLPDFEIHHVTDYPDITKKIGKTKLEISSNIIFVR